MATAVGLSGGSSLHSVTDDQKRWLVFGIALSKVLVAQIRPFVEQEVQKEYGNLQTSHNIHTQSTSGRLKNWPTFLKYENINSNDAHLRLPGGRYNYSLFDCRVLSHVDFAKLYVENHMAKFNVFDEHCDASAVLALLGKVPVFSHAVQSAAGDVRQARNAWAHCVFSDWDPVNYQQSFDEMEKLVKALGLLPAFERTLLGELKDWETKGTILCMNATVDPVVLKLVQQHVNALKTDVEQLTFDVQEDKDRLSQTLKDISTSLEELEARVVSVQRKQEVMRQEQSFLSRTVDALSIEIDTRVVSVRREQEVIKQEQSSLSNKVYALQTEIDTSVVSMQCEQDIMKQEQSSLTKKVDTLKIQHDTTQVQLKSLEFQQEDVQQRVAHVEEQLSSVIENREDCSYKDPANVISQQHKASVSVEIASFEADIAFFAKRHDSDTRQWFFDDFDAWFHDPGDSRAYVLLGDPGVGKSVMAAVLAQHMRRTGHLGSAYFCRHNDGTRNDPRYLLGTVACQLCEINSQYNTIVGGESGVRNLLGNSKLGIQELFTKLLQEPLAKCNPNQQRKLVIIDALDETEYESREDFLDLIMHRFPLLPEWLVFFITSRPEDSVQFRLKKYNPCVKICAGNSIHRNFYQQHEQDIQTFLKKRIDYSRFSCTVEDIARKCHGLFLYAHYIVEELKLSVDLSKKLNQLSVLFPGDIDDFFLQNFKRVYDQVGHDLFKKLFGCAVVAPSPLPVSIISYILKREKSNHVEKQVIDAVSQFVVLRTSDQTLTFLHNLIPAWLTDKRKARKLFIDKKIAGEYLRKIFAEILASVVNEPTPASPSIEADLEGYVSRVAVRFLCQYCDRDSFKAFFRCLTSYRFIERRMLSGRTEIYHLLEDLKLAADCVAFEEVKKQEVLQEILFVLESNVLVLLECPQLLQSCIRNASNVVRETVIIPQVSAPWLKWNVVAFPDPKIADMQCFAASRDKRTVAGAKGRSIQFFDASTAETVKGPFEISNSLINEIAQLEFSPDGKFIFFGRLDKWFSVERRTVEDFPQFSGNSHVHKWGVFTRDGQSIVVKRSFLRNPGTCQAKSCLFNVLALWAQKEIEQSRDDEMTVTFCPQELCRVPGVQVKRLFKCLGIEKNVDQTCETLVPYDASCHYCCRLKELTETSQESSLAAVRQLVIELYPWIFVYQVWDLRTGMPVLQQVFSQSVQLNPFTYLCHVASAYSECGLKMKCCGTENAMSVCNIATVTVVCSSLLGGFYFGPALELEMQWKREQEWKREWAQKRMRNLRLKPKEDCLRRGCGPKQQQAGVWESMWEQRQEWERAREWECKWKQELIHLLELWRKLPQTLRQNRELKLEWTLEWKQEQELQTKVLEQLVLEWKRLVSTGLFKEFHHEGISFALCTNIPKSFQDLVYKVTGKIRICVSPKMKWIIEAGDSLKLLSLQTGNQVHTISKYKRFSFTNDDLYLVYSCEGSLRALSLETGTVLTSVLGCNLCYFARERQVGYLFLSDTEKRAIFLTNLFSPFKFLSVSPVKRSFVANTIAASFCSSDTVISVSSNSTVTLWHTTASADKEGITFVSGSWRRLEALRVKNCALSADGKLIAIHQGTKVGLYSCAKSGAKFLHSVFESKCEFTVAYFAFSADCTVLLSCIQDNRNKSYLYVWDVQKGVVLASFESPGFLDTECCCLSSNRRELILCGEYEIEIWEYAEHSCRFLTRLAVEKPYNSVKFSYCTVSLDNQFLVCCIADIILVYSLHSTDIYSSKQVLRGHLGRIEFCRFLKVNHYLISYGVDGMVFLWDLTESKAVGFAKITQDQDSILTMAVSPEEDKAVCFTSSGRVCVIKLCELGSALSLKPLTAPLKSKEETAETRLPPLEQIPSASQLLTSSVEDDMAEAMSISDSEEDFLDYYLEHDPLDESD